MRLLDLGAGAGKAGPVNFRHEVAEVVGIDPDPAISGNGHVDRRVLGMAEGLPFQAESFDLVLADWVVEHLANPVRGLPRDRGDPFPTYYRMNTCAEVRRVLTHAGFVEETLLTVEAEPSYLMFSVPSFLLGVASERLVNYLAYLAGFRACLFGCFRKG
jgi:hypothetical protein